MYKILLIFLSVLSLYATQLYEELSNDNSIIQESLNARFRTYYETIPLSKGRDMGVVGTHFDFSPFESFNQLYMGLGFISAVTGDEGGFFSYGYTLGIDYKFYKDFHIDGGAYIGGGSGDYIGFENGGMIIRSHAALSYELNSIEIVLGLSRTDFPNTTTNKEYQSDIHPYFGVNISNDIWNQSNDINQSHNVIDFDGFFSDIRITPVMIMHKIDDKPTKRAEKFKPSEAYQADFPMIGMQFDKFLTDKIFVSLEAHAALSSAAGYMALQAGLGYDFKLLDSLVWESKMVLGSAGDSKIDTGGGLILQPMTGLRFEMTPSFSLKTLVGRTYAPSGTFSATTYEAGLSWRASQPTSKEGKYRFRFDYFDRIEWIMSPSIKIYFPYNSAHKQNKEESSKKIGLIGITLAVPLSEWFSLVGSTHWATTGNVGEYAEGLIGAKLSTPQYTALKISANVQCEIGAGAGDGINTTAGGGYITQVLAGFKLPISKYTGFTLNAGQMQTSDGKFKASTILLALDIDLNILVKK